MYRRGLFEKSESYFRAAISKQTWKNPNPYDGEPYFNLGLALLKQNKVEDAYGAFYKATWNEATQASAFYQIACIDSRKGEFELAIEHINQALIKNYHNIKARGLKAIVLRMLGRVEEARVLIYENLKIDKFDYVSYFEIYQISQKESDRDVLQKMIKQGINQYLELALDYMQGGFYELAIQILEMCPQKNPLVYYYKGYAQQLMGNKDGAVRSFEQAQISDPTCCFPNKIEEILILEMATGFLEEGSFAYYYLGNLWYDKGQYKKAVSSWERSIELNDKFPTAYRNLALAYFNKQENHKQALVYLERAFNIDQTDARVFLELDQLYKKLNYSLQVRRDKMENHFTVIESRDDLMIEYITVLNSLGEYEKAYVLTMGRKFHPWEGGEGKITSQYVFSLTEMAKINMVKGQYEEALERLTKALSYPENLGEGKLPNTQDNIIYYHMAQVYMALNEDEKVQMYFKKASTGLKEPTDMMFYNDQPADTIFYQGKAYEAMGMITQANERFDTLISYAREHMDDVIKIDYFAVSLPDTLIFEENLQKKNQIHCLYLQGLGFLGRGEVEKASEYLELAQTLNVSHQGISRHLMLI